MQKVKNEQECNTYFVPLVVCFFREHSPGSNSNGEVTDERGEPLPGSTFVIEGTTAGVITDINGVYSISAPGNASFGFSTLSGLTGKLFPFPTAV